MRVVDFDVCDNQNIMSKSEQEGIVSHPNHYSNWDDFGRQDHQYDLQEPILRAND